MNAEVSVIIPLYNTEKYITETIQSVINQSFTNWELIIIDDGSTDSSSLKVKTFLTDSRITYHHQANSGVSVARNNGIKLATAKHIAFLDADDVWKKTNLEEKLIVLKDETVDFVFCDIELINERSESILTTLVGTDEDMLKHNLLWDKDVIPTPCSNLVLKKKCMDGGLKFDTNFSTAADQDFCFYLNSKYRGKRIPKALCNYRILANSMSRNIALMEKDHIGVYKKADTNNLFSSYFFKKKCFSNLYSILAGSWWKNGNNKTRGSLFIFLSIVNYPPNVFKFVKKLFGA